MSSKERIRINIAQVVQRRELKYIAAHLSHAHAGHAVLFMKMDSTK